jgi:hypothetical protein
MELRVLFLGIVIFLFFAAAGHATPRLFAYLVLLAISALAIRYFGLTEEPRSLKQHLLFLPNFENPRDTKNLAAAMTAAAISYLVVVSLF